MDLKREGLSDNKHGKPVCEKNDYTFKIIHSGFKYKAFSDRELYVFS